MSKPTELEVLEAGRWLAQCAAAALHKLTAAQAPLAGPLREAIADWKKVEAAAREAPPSGE